MNTDLSVAPEIARLADPIADAPRNAAAPRTDGRVAGSLLDLAAAPQRWWDLVRFDAGGPVRIPLPDVPGTWLLVLPPGATTDCDCRQATALAGEAVETAGAGMLAGAPAASGAGLAAGGQAGTDGASHPLRTGRIRVHGTRASHRVRAAGPGYSVTLHWTASRTRSA